MAKEPSSSAAPPAVPTESPRLEKLPGPQLALYKQLSALPALDSGVLISDIYLSAILVLADSRNPNRFALSAHGIREMLEKLSDVTGVLTPAHRQKLGSKVAELQLQWEKASKDVVASPPGDLPRVHKALAAFFEKFGKFVEWRRNHQPARKKERGKVLAKLDKSGLALPPPLESLNVQFWEEMHEFFQAVAHHGRKTDPEEFGTWQGAMERFLLDRLCPPTYDDFQAIDEILQGTNGNSNS